MTRVAIPTPRIVTPSQRPRVLPLWLKGRASIYFDPTDDRATGAIPADLTGASALTIMARLLPLTRHTATNRGGVSFGTNVADQGAYLGQNIVGGRAYIGGGLIGTVLTDSIPSEVGQWSPAMYRYNGGAGGTTTLAVGTRSTAGVATANITGVVAELGRLLAAGTCFGGCVADARIYSRAITDAEYDAWRLGIDEPANARRLWTCENPGYGTTVYEQIGGTSDVMSGALYDPRVPFRRARVVEDVGACPNLGTTTLTMAAHADLEPESQSFALGGWFNFNASNAAPAWVAAKYGGGGWAIDTESKSLKVYVSDGVTTLSTPGGSVQIDPAGWRHISFVIDQTRDLLFLHRDALRPTILDISTIAGAIDSASNMILPGGAPSSVTGVNDLWIVKGRVVSWDEIEAAYFDGVIPAGAYLWSAREAAGTNVASNPAGHAGTLAAANWLTNTRCHARTAA